MSYLAIQVTEGGKWYAHIWRVKESDNLRAVLDRLHAETANVYPTRRAAVAAVESLRESYRRNKCEMFPEEF